MTPREQFEQSMKTLKRRSIITVFLVCGTAMAVCMIGLFVQKGS